MQGRASAPHDDSLVEKAFVVPFVILIGIYGLFVAGDFEVWGIDIRGMGVVPMALAAIVVVAAKTSYRRSVGTHKFLLPFTCWVAWMMLSSLWAPAGARVQENIIDLAYLLGFVVVAAFVLRRMSSRALNWLWAIVYSVALVFAVTALLADSVTIGQGRLIAFGGGPNIFVRIVGLGAVAAAALAIGGGRRGALILAGVPIVAVAALLSGSRGGMLALSIAAVAVLVLALRSRSRAIRVQVVSAVIITGVAFAFWGWPLVEGYVRRRFVQQTLEQGYTSGRTDIWEISMRLWQEHLLVGQGLDGFWVGSDQAFAHAHNLLVGTVVEGGLIGVVLLGIALATGFRAAYRANSFSANLPAVAALLIFVSAMFSGTWYDSRLLWLFLFVGAEMCARRDVESGEAQLSGAMQVSTVGAQGVAGRVHQRPL